MEESKYFYDQSRKIDRWVGLNTTAVEFLAQKKRSHSLIIAALLILAGCLFLFLIFQVNKRVVGFVGNPSIQAGQIDNHGLLVREIQAIKNQFGMLLIGSIENKVNSIEQKIRSGTVNRRDIILIQALKSDLKILKSQTVNAISNGAGLSSGYVGNSAISSDLNGVVERDPLVKEISNLYNFVYVGFASFGFLFAAVGGLWVQNYYLIKRLDSRLEKTSFLLENKNYNS